MRTRETGSAEMRAHAADMHAAGTHPSAPAAMHPSSHAAMHASSHAATMTTASKHRRGKRKRRSKCPRDEATKELFVHPNPSMVEFQATDTVARRRRPADPKWSNDFN